MLDTSNTEDTGLVFRKHLKIKIIVCSHALKHAHLYIRYILDTKGIKTDILTLSLTPQRNHCLAKYSSLT